MKKLKLSVEDMTCGHCKARITETLSVQTGVGDVNADLDTKTVEVETDLPAEKLIDLIDDAGYTAVEVK